MTMLDAFLAGTASIALAIFGATLLGICLRLFFVDKDEIGKNASRAKDLRAFFGGQLSSRSDPVPDSRIKEGVRFNRKLKRLEPQGGLSQEAIRKGLNWRWL